MSGSDPPIVTDAEGRRGILLVSPAESGEAGALLPVEFEDGTRAEIPASALLSRPDGSLLYPHRFAGADGAARAHGAAAGAAQEAAVIPVLEEELRVGKRVVETGGVRVRKTVREREELIDEPLMREEVEVERVPVGRVVDGPVPVRREGETTIVSILEEVIVVEKRLVLKEELHIRRRQVETRDPRRVTLRSEEVTIERLGEQDRQTTEGVRPESAESE